MLSTGQASSEISSAICASMRSRSSLSLILAARAAASLIAAEAALAEADSAAGTSTQFVLLAVMFALVLFFASVATKFSAPKIQVALILTGLTLLVVTTVRMLLLPQSL